MNKIINTGTNYEDLIVERQIKNKVVSKYLLGTVTSLLHLISDYNLPYKLALEFDPENKEIDEYMPIHHRDFDYE